MSLQHVVGYPGHVVYDGVPRHLDELPVDPQQRRLQAIRCRPVRVVHLPGESAATDAVIAAYVDHVCAGVGLDDNMVAHTVNQRDVVLVGADPADTQPHREVGAERVLAGRVSAVFAHGPREHTISTGDDAAIARRRDHPGVSRRERHLGQGYVF